MPGLCVVFLGGFMFRWTEIQCTPGFSGNFTPSGHTVKVTTGNKVARMEGFTFVVRNVKVQAKHRYLNIRLSQSKCLLVSASRNR